ncbi:MAG: benzoylsuccinyl-CoA thiolase [Propionibacterium sp.]|nr:benzoylsuccinyl-CoA thiolase [Propionibacterium sp.]
MRGGAVSATPIIDWFTTGDEPALLGTKCVACGTVYFPRQDIYCKNPNCDSEEFEEYTFSRTGTVWSYTDFQYQPPAPYIAQTDPYEPFALAAVELPEGIVVLGQLADGYSVDDVKVGSPVELVVEVLNTDDTGDRTIWRWKPTEEAAR